ncbi:unnamed protein product [Rhizophagus irregularis]|nr:unnamed protein product [Rhizophagus irregularis]
MAIGPKLKLFLVNFKLNLQNVILNRIFVLKHYKNNITSFVLFIRIFLTITTTIFHHLITLKMITMPTN